MALRERFFHLFKVAHAREEGGFVQHGLCYHLWVAPDEVQADNGSGAVAPHVGGSKRQSVEQGGSVVTLRFHGGLVTGQRTAGIAAPVVPEDREAVVEKLRHPKELIGVALCPGDEEQGRSRTVQLVVEEDLVGFHRAHRCELHPDSLQAHFPKPQSPETSAAACGRASSV